MYISDLFTHNTIFVSNHHFECIIVSFGFLSCKFCVCLLYRPPGIMVSPVVYSLQEKIVSYILGNLLPFLYSYMLVHRLSSVHKALRSWIAYFSLFWQSNASHWVCDSILSYTLVSSQDEVVTSCMNC